MSFLMKVYGYYLSGTHYIVMWCILDAVKDTSYHTDHPYSWTLRVNFYISGAFTSLPHPHYCCPLCELRGNCFDFHVAPFIKQLLCFSNCFLSPDRFSLFCDLKLTEEVRSCGT